jgi:hypothetical protein
MPRIFDAENSSTKFSIIISFIILFLLFYFYNRHFRWQFFMQLGFFNKPKTPRQIFKNGLTSSLPFQEGYTRP